MLTALRQSHQERVADGSPTSCPHRRKYHSQRIAKAPDAKLTRNLSLRKTTSQRGQVTSSDSHGFSSMESKFEPRLPVVLILCVLCYINQSFSLLSTVVHTCIPATQEAEAGSQVLVQLGQHNALKHKIKSGCK